MASPVVGPSVGFCFDNNTNVSSEIYLVNFSKIYLRFIGVKLIGYQASDYMDKSILWFSVSGMF